MSQARDFRPSPSESMGRLVFVTLLAMVLVPRHALAQPAEVATMIDLDINAFEIGGDLLLDGETMPGYSEGGLALIGLTDRHGRDTPIAGTVAGRYGPALFLEGDYTPSYRVDFSNGELPLNSAALFPPGLSLTNDATHDLDVPRRSFQFEFRLNGAPFPAVPGNQARFSLRHRETGDEFPIGFATAGTVNIHVLPGIYDVVYSHIEGTQIPGNTHAIVRSRLDLRNMRRTTVVDVEAAPLSLTATLNGGAFPVDEYETAWIGLYDAADGDTVPFGRTDVGLDTRWVIRGTYDATYERILGGNVVPRNLSAIIDADIVVGNWSDPDPIPTATVDVEMVEITPVMTLNGVAFPGSDYESADIFLVGDNGDEIHIAWTSNLVHDVVRIIPGRYDAYYRRILGGNIVPRNGNAPIALDLEIEASGDLALDVESQVVVLDYTLDGESFPTSEYEFGRFYFVGEGEGDSSYVAASHSPANPFRLMRGTYDVVYDLGLGGDQVPRNRNTIVLHDVVIDEDEDVTVDVETRVVVADVSLNGNDFPSDASEVGHVFLRDATGGELLFGATHLGPQFEMKVIEGAYAVDYEWQSGVQVPRNGRHTLAYVAVPEPGFLPAISASAGLLLIAAKRRRGRIATTRHGSVRT